MKNRKIYVCVDSSIFLTEVFGNEKQQSKINSIDECEQIYEFERCITKTVKLECQKRFKSVISLIGIISKEFQTQFSIYKATNKTVSMSDLSFVNSFFATQKRQLSGKSTELEILDKMETILVRYSTQRLSKSNMTYFDYIVKWLVEVNKVNTALRFEFYKRLGTYKEILHPVNASTCQKLRGHSKLQKTVNKKPNDITILCEVEALYSSTNDPCILVTTDSRDFLDNASLIKGLVGVICVDPLYLAAEIKNYYP